MPSSNISTIKNKLTGGGARPNLFRVQLGFPASLSAGNSLGDSILVKAAGLPSSNVGMIDVPVRGLFFKVAGDRTFDTWTITILTDTDYALRGLFERWMNLVRKLSNNSGNPNPNDYMVDGVKVFQLDRNENSLREYEFEGIFPTNISQIDLSSDSTDTIEEFTVELQVQSYKIVKPNTANTAPAVS